MPNIMQDWVLERCTLRMQGVITLAHRGPDGSVKESAAKPIVRTLRGLTMNSAKTGGKPAKDDLFMIDTTIRHPSSNASRDWGYMGHAFFSELDSYNVHFYFHLLHAYAVVGITHPEDHVRGRCWWLYTRGVAHVHCHPENEEEIRKRLADD